MELTPYYQGKRYADIMKTMWFTFLYATCIPLGTFFSMLSLIMYYFIDRYNVLRRSTIKESLGPELSIEMIELLEWCLIVFVLGTFTFYRDLFGKTEVTTLILLGIAFIYSILPLQSITEHLFPVEN